MPGGVAGDSPAGDTVEIVKQVRGTRARKASLRIRASARFVEAAQRAQKGRWERIPAAHLFDEAR